MFENGERGESDGIRKSVEVESVVCLVSCGLDVVGVNVMQAVEERLSEERQPQWRRAYLAHGKILSFSKERAR